MQGRKSRRTRRPALPSASVRTERLESRTLLTGDVTNAHIDSGNGDYVSSQDVARLRVAAASTDIIVDNGSATFTGGWVTSTNTGGYYGGSYAHDANGSKGSKTATFAAGVGAGGGTFRVAVWHVARGDFASNVPVDVYTSSGVVTVTLNERAGGGQWRDLGEYAFDGATGPKVVIRNTGTNGFVVADAVRFTPVQTTPPVPPVSPTGFVPLFNGVDLDGFYTWTDSHGKNNDTEGYFKVDNGMLHVLDLPATTDEKEFGYIATEAEYSNYHLRFQYQWGTKKFAPRDAASMKRDSGVMLHLYGEDQVWPQSFEVQVQEGDVGDIWLLWDAGQEPTMDTTVVSGSNPKRYDPAGVAHTQQGGRLVKSQTADTLTGWNAVEVIAEGNNFTIMVNGVVVNRATNVRRPDPDNPGQTLPLTSGRIAFQAEGAEVLYRNIEIRPLPSPPAPDDAVVLFDGTDALAFERRNGGGPVGWPVTNGVMTVGAGTGDIRTTQSFDDDYTLHVEFKTNVKGDAVAEQDRGNSGIVLAGSYEVQVLDSYNRPLAGENDLGSIYGIANAQANAALPAGVWQSYDIKFTAARWSGDTKIADARVSLWLNGILVQDDVAIPTNTFTFDAESPGAKPIMIQDHGNAVQYRNIWVMPE